MIRSIAINTNTKLTELWKIIKVSLKIMTSLYAEFKIEIRFVLLNNITQTWKADRLQRGNVGCPRSKDFQQKAFFMRQRKWWMRNVKSTDVVRKAEVQTSMLIFFVIKHL